MFLGGNIIFFSLTSTVERVLRGLVICFSLRVWVASPPARKSSVGKVMTRAKPARQLGLTGRQASKRKTPNSESPLSCKKALGPP